MPSAVESAFHVIDETASVTSPSSDLIGLVGFVSVTVAVRPGPGCTLSEASGLAAGKRTATAVVLAVSLSVGTRNDATTNPPGAAPGASTVTCADAGPATANPPSNTPR